MSIPRFNYRYRYKNTGTEYTPSVGVIQKNYINAADYAETLIEKQGDFVSAHQRSWFHIANAKQLCLHFKSTKNPVVKQRIIWSLKNLRPRIHSMLFVQSLNRTIQEFQAQLKGVAHES